MKIDLTGQKFGKLTVVGEEGTCPTSRGITWRCLCDCGTLKVVRGNSLRMGKSKSCGCSQKEKPVKHGLCNHPLYEVYQGMKKRCYYDKHNQYHNYGGRGIKVCDRWLESFENFYNDVIEGYEKGLQLDRRNNDGNYESDNVRWVTKQQNDFNRRSRPNSSSKFKGVSWNTSKHMWVAQR